MIWYVLIHGHSTTIPLSSQRCCHTGSGTPGGRSRSGAGTGCWRASSPDPRRWRGGSFCWDTSASPHGRWCAVQMDRWLQISIIKAHDVPAEWNTHISLSILKNVVMCFGWLHLHFPQTMFFDWFHPGSERLHFVWSGKLPDWWAWKHHVSQGLICFADKTAPASQMSACFSWNKFSELVLSESKFWDVTIPMLHSQQTISRLFWEIQLNTFLRGLDVYPPEQQHLRDGEWKLFQIHPNSILRYKLVEPDQVKFWKTNKQTNYKLYRYLQS